MKHYKILAIGECMIELHQTAQHSFSAGYAGDTFNTLYYLAQESHIDAYYMTAIGQCAQSKKMKHFFNSNNIKTNYVFEHPSKHPGLYMIENRPDGERSFVYYREQSAARSLLSFITKNIESALQQFNAIYLSGITLGILSDADATKLINIIKNYRQQGGTIFFDNNFRSPLWTSPQYAQTMFKRIHPYCDVLFISYEDEQSCYGATNIEASIERYQNLNALTVIKNGAAPAITIEQQSCQQWPTHPVNQVIDTTGAGDAYNAGFIASYLIEQDLQLATTEGARLASQVIQHKGAII